MNVRQHVASIFLLLPSHLIRARIFTLWTDPPPAWPSVHFLSCSLGKVIARRNQHSRYRSVPTSPSSCIEILSSYELNSIKKITKPPSTNYALPTAYYNVSSEPQRPKRPSTMWCSATWHNFMIMLMYDGIYVNVCSRVIVNNYGEILNLSMGILCILEVHLFVLPVVC